MERFLVIVAIATHLAAASTAKYNITISKDCMEKKGLCFEKPNNYDKYLEAMENSLRMSDLQLRSSDDDTEDYEVRNVGENCAYKVQYQQPFVFVGKDTEALIIQTDYFKQKVERVECMSTDDTDTYINGECFRGLSFGWKGQCRTQKTVMSLIAYNMKLDHVEPLEIEVPIMCYCSVSKNEIK